MTKNYVFVSLVFILCFPFTESYAQPKIKLSFSTIENSVNAQVSSAVMTEAYKRIGVQIEIIPLPAKRTLIESNKGRFDGELFRLDGINIKWPNLIRVNVPINYMEGVVITTGLTFEVDGWKSLQLYEIGIRRGIRFSDDGTIGMKRQIVNSNKILFSMLKYDRLDLIVVTRSNGLKEMKILNDPNFKMLEPTIETYPLFHYLHTKNKAMVPKIEAVLLRMQNEGALEKIRHQVLNEFM